MLIDNESYTYNPKASLTKSLSGFSKQKHVNLYIRHIKAYLQSLKAISLYK